MSSTSQKPITLDQVVAFNLRRARQLRSWTQSQAAERLEPYLGERWSSAVFSAAERSFEGSRVREFTASHVLAFARGFDLPITWFFLPPDLDSQVTSRGSTEALTGLDLLWLLVPEIHPEQGRMARAAAFRGRLTELAGDESLETVTKAGIPLPLGMADYQSAARLNRVEGEVGKLDEAVEQLANAFVVLADGMEDGPAKDELLARARLLAEQRSAVFNVENGGDRS